MDTKRGQRSPLESLSPGSRSPQLKRHNSNASPDMLMLSSMVPEAPSTIASIGIIKPIPSKPSTTRPKSSKGTTTTTKTSTAATPKQKKTKSSQRVLPPGVVASGGKWSAEEDRALKQAVENLGARNWKRISEVAFGHKRSDVQCLHRWQKVLKPGLVKGPWTKHEDEVVFKLVTEHGVGNIKWSVIASQLPGRLGKQARERWYNHLDPTLKKEGWSPEEDAKLMELQAKMGNRWCEISKLLEGRSENAVKNRWNSARRKRLQAERMAANNGAATTKKTSTKKKQTVSRAKRTGASTSAKGSKSTPRSAATPPLQEGRDGNIPTEKSSKRGAKAKKATRKKGKKGAGSEIAGSSAVKIAASSKQKGKRGRAKGGKKSAAARKSTPEHEAARRAMNASVSPTSPEVGTVETLSDFSFDMGIEHLTMGLASFGSVGSSGMSPQTAVQYGFSPPEPKGNDSFYAALGFEPFLRQSPPAADATQKGIESSGQRIKQQQQQQQQAQQAQRQHQKHQKQTQSQNQRQKAKRKEGHPAGNDQQKVSPIKHADAVSPFGLFAGSGSSYRSPPMIGMNLAQSLDQKTAYLDGMFERMVDDWDLVPEGNPVI